MKIVQVIPITRGISKKETLSYFTSGSIQAGSVVSVPLRSKTIPALVVSLEDASQIKSEIKSLPFQIRKIEEIYGSYFLSTEFIESCKATSEYFATSLGSILDSLLPKTILANISDISIPKVIRKERREAEKFVLQASDEERITTYKSLVREEFARQSSVYCCVPTIEDGKRIVESLKKGIEDYTIFLHGSLKKKELISLWNRCAEEKHPLLIIATGTFFGIPRNDIGTILFEKENSKAYKLPSRPYLDLRTFGEFFAEKSHARFILADTLLRTETLYHHEQGEYVELSALKWRLFTNRGETIVDMKKNTPGEKGSFEVLSQELKELLTKARDKNEKMFLFGLRKGYQPTTVCRDCGSLVVCEKCNTPSILYKKENVEENFFLCQKCGERTSALKLCKACGSWRLNPLGIGIDLIIEEVKKHLPGVKIFQMDKDIVKTAKQAEAVISEFYGTPGGILIGTEMALLYLSKNIENSAIVSIDSLFSIPDFRINEKILNILLKIRSITDSRFIIQTRNTEQKVLSYATTGNLIDFYREEIKERKVFDYPPFSTLIKISLVGEENRVMEEMEKLYTLFTEYNPAIFPAFIPRIKGKYTMHALIKIPYGKWVDKNLLEKLIALPVYFSIRVDPENLL